MSFQEYFRFLVQFETPPLEALASHRGPRGEKPFELP